MGNYRGGKHSQHPSFGGKMLYEGCPRLCLDGRMYELGKNARCKMWSHDGLPDVNSCKRDDHVYVGIGQGIPMFNVVVDINNYDDIDVFEFPRMQLFDMTGWEWNRVHGPLDQPSSITNRIQSWLWTMRLVTWWREGAIWFRKAIFFAAFLIFTKFKNIAHSRIQLFPSSTHLSIESLIGLHHHL